jgi:hypothetical protein
MRALEDVDDGERRDPHAVALVDRRRGLERDLGDLHLRTKYDGPVTIAQDLSTFTITKDAVVTRQPIIDPYAWTVVGPTTITGPPMNPPGPPSAWWAEALLTD